MKIIDYSSLDGRSLRTFLTVLEENSVSAAAERMGITQSAVSHTLDKLRIALSDQLFVRSGRGIMPTARARSLKLPIQAVLDDLKALTDDRSFDPQIGTMEFTVAANDFQRELLFPDIVRRIQKTGIDCRFKFLPSGVPTVRLLREARCQLIVSPLPPEGADIHTEKLFEDGIACFYDADCRAAPQKLEDLIESEFIEVRFPDYSSSMSALKSIDMSKLKKPKITVPNFGDVTAFLKGTDFIVVAMSLMRLGPFKELDNVALPLPHDRLTMWLAWHRRDHTDPAHHWLRNQVKDAAKISLTFGKQNT